MIMISFYFNFIFYNHLFTHILYQELLHDTKHLLAVFLSNTNIFMHVYGFN